MLDRIAVDPDQHPVDQYRLGTEYFDIVQYLVILYLHSKLSYYKKSGTDVQYVQRMAHYKDLAQYFDEFDTFLQHTLDAKDYAEVKGSFDSLHTALLGTVYKPLLTKTIFRKIKPDIPHVHSTKLKPILRDMALYFIGGSTANQKVEESLIDELSILRNPRLRKMLESVREDLPKMAQAEVPVVDQAALNTMDRVQLTTLVRDTTDVDTLNLLWKHCVAVKERTAIAAFFMKGYRGNYAHDTYRYYKLVTQANFKRLSDDVLYDYLTNMPSDWQRMFSGKAMEALYQGVLPGRDALLAKFVAGVVEGKVSIGGGGNEKALYTVASRHLPSSAWTPEIIRALWKYSDDPDPMVRRLDKDERIKQFLLAKGGLTASTWLFDITKQDLLDIMKSGMTVDSDTYARVFGIGWGEMMKDSLDGPTTAKFLSKISSADVQILEQSVFMTNFKEMLSDYTLRNSYPGGPVAWFKNIFKEASIPAKALLLTIVGHGQYSNAVEEHATDPEISSHLASMRNALNEKKAEGWKWFQESYPGGWGSFSPYEISKVFIKLPDDKLLSSLKDIFKVQSYVPNSEILYDYTAKNCPVEDLIDLVDILVTAGHYGASNALASCLDRMPSSYALQLVRIKSSSVQEWVAVNYPEDKLVFLVKQNPEYLESVCAIADRIPSSDTAEFSTIIATNWPPNLSTSLKESALACVVKNMKGTDSFLTDTSILVRQAAVNGATSARVEDMLTKSTDSYHLVLERDDFPTEAPKYVKAILTPSSGLFKDMKLSGLDLKVPKMTDAVFLQLVDQIEAARASRTAPYTNPWGFLAYERLYLMNASKDLQDKVRSSYLTLNFNDTALRDKYVGAFTPERLYKLYHNGPWKGENSNVLHLLIDGYKGQNGSLDVISDAELESFSLITTYHLKPGDPDWWSWDMGYRITREIQERANVKLVQAKGDLTSQVLALNADRKYEEIARLMEDSLKGPHGAAIDVLTMIYRKTRDEDLQVNLAAHAAPALLDVMVNRGADNIPAVVSAIAYSKESWFDSNFNIFLETFFARHVEDKNPGAGKNRDVTIKSAIIARANAKQALDLFKFFFLKQKEFGPKSRDAFVDKLEDDDFKKLLKSYLMSKEFNLRVKAFTLDMVPIVMKLDDTSVTAKFNGSSHFRAKAIGKIEDYYDGLSSVDKETFLDTLNDRSMLEKLLKALVEKTVPLSAAVNEEFNIGTNDANKANVLLSKFQLSTRTTSHLELYNLAIQHATTDDIKEWIRHNPLLVFQYNKAAADANASTFRVDAVPDDVDTKIAKDFLDTWDNRAHSGFSGTVERVYRVVTPRKAIRDTGSVTTLWHGTDYFAAGCIIQGGFKVMRSARTGRLLGDGIYFADVASKVMQYSGKDYGHGDGAGVVLVCEVDLGKMLTISNDGTNSHLQTTWMNHGYDSVYMPRGAPYGGRRLLNSEYCVADVNRIKILYVMDLSRKSSWR